MPIDYNDYPENWPELRQQVLDRDQHKCSKCGVPQYGVGYRIGPEGKFMCLATGWSCLEAKVLKDIHSKEYPNQKLIIIVLTVAHLDHDEWNHNVKLDRLAAMCQRCHLAYDREDNQRRKDYGKHYRRHQLELFATI